MMPQADAQAADGATVAETATTPSPTPVEAISPVVLDADAILAAEDRLPVDVSVPKWGGIVRLMPLDGDALQAYTDSLFELVDDGKGGQVMKPKMTNVAQKCRLIAACAIKADGTPAFRPDQVALLTKKDAATLSEVIAVAMRINGFSEELQKALGKDSDAAGSGGPSSASHTN